MRLPFSTLAVTVFLCAKCCLSEEENDSPEKLFRHASDQWQRRGRRDWEPWLELSDVLADRFTEAQDRLEIVGAIEESILAIERYIFNGDDRNDPDRDQALSKLYEAYGKLLSWLSPSECVQLALDPHTLLIGAETVNRSGSQSPSNQLCVENAENSLRNAVSLDATNAQASRLLDSITKIQGSGHKRKPKEFVAELFDSFADSFDDKLEKLQYRVPELVGQAARFIMTNHLHKDNYANALDAGCGTGLVGRHLRPIVSGALVGVDASRKMLDIAGQCTLASGCGAMDIVANDDNNRPLYEMLLNMDLEDLTPGNTLGSDPRYSQELFDLIVAADVFVYFDSLESILQKFALISGPGSVLIFSCERADNDEAPLGWRLLPSGRFAHTKHHVETKAANAGYSLISYSDITPRMEKGEPVNGSLYGFILQERHDEL